MLWNTRPLGDLAAPDDGAIAIGPFGSSMKSDLYVTEGVPIVRGMNLDGQPGFRGEFVFVENKTADRFSRCQIVPGDLVFPHRGAIGSVGLAVDQPPGRWLLSTSLMKFRADRKKLDPLYAFHFFRSERGRHELLKNASQVGTPGIGQPLASLRACEIPIPPIGEQRAIAGVLGALDDKIEQNQRTARALERLARAIFRAWFVDFEPVKAKAAGATSFPSMPQHVFDALPTRFVDSEIGPVPEGWDVSNIGMCSSYLSRGITPKYIQEGGVLVVNQKCIRDSTIDFTKARRHDSELKKIDGRGLAIGDVLINSTGVGTLGRVAQVLNLPEPTVADSHVTVVRPSSNLSWAFLGQALMLKQPVIEAMGEGSTGQTELSRKKVSELLLAVPPNSVLSAFDENVVPLMRLISTTLKESKKLAELRDLLLPKVLSGEVRVAVNADRPEVLP